MLYSNDTLYSNEIPGVKRDEFIFDAEPYNLDIDIRTIAAIQEFYEKNGYVPDFCIPDLLNWITYQVRSNICNGIETPLYSSFAGRCANAQAFNSALGQKLKFAIFSFNIGDVIGTDKIHAVCFIQIPTVIDGKPVNIPFMLDPTFRQFCIAEENRFERYNEEPRWAVRMSCPHPGYFFNLTEEGRKFANDLIHFGYFEITEDSLKAYFDPFVLYTTPKESYKKAEDVGKISTTSNSGKDYWKAIMDNEEKPFNVPHKFDLATPKEIVAKRNNNPFLWFRDILAPKQELDAMFSKIEIPPSKNAKK